MFDPVEFLGRLAVLVPRPRINLILYYGVLGPRAAWRADVVRRQTAGDGRDAGVKESATGQGREADPADTARRQARGQCWALLMARTFGFWVLSLPHRLRYLLAWDHELCRAVTGVALFAVEGSSVAFHPMRRLTRENVADVVAFSSVSTNGARFARSTAR